MTVAAPAAWPRLEDVVDPIRQIIDGTDQITCLAHKDADADSLGSALGFALALRSRGPQGSCCRPRAAAAAARAPPRLRDGRRPVERRSATPSSPSTAPRSGGSASGAAKSSAPARWSTSTTTSATPGSARSTSSMASASATGQVIHRLLRELGAPDQPGGRDQPLRGAVHRHRRLPPREHHRGGAPPRGRAGRRGSRPRLGRAQELQVTLSRAGAPRGPRHRADALRDGRTPALVRGHRVDARAGRSRPAGLRGHHRRAPEHRHHGDRDSLQGTLSRPQQDQRAHARAHRRDRRLHAVRRWRPPHAPPAPSSRDSLPVAERKVLEVARRLIDSAG